MDYTQHWEFRTAAAYRWYLNCISMISELRLTMMMTCACWYCICTELRKAVNTFVLIYYHNMPFIGQTGIFYTNLLSHFLPEISSCLKNKFFVHFGAQRQLWHHLQGSCLMRIRCLRPIQWSPDQTQSYLTIKNGFLHT